MISKQDIENWFTYHDDPNKVPRYKAIREAAKYLAGIIVDNTPHSADQTAAIRLLRESVMTANAAIACEQPDRLVGMIAEASKDANYVSTSSPREEQIRFLERQLKDAHDQIRRSGGVPLYDISR